jgi:hypothetical protein
LIFRTTEAPFMPEDVDFLSRASGQIAIAIENALAYREISELKDKLAQEKLYLEEEFRSEMGFEQIIGNSSALKHALELVETVAQSDSTVLLLGETGTGKELIARHSRPKPSQTADTREAELRCNPDWAGGKRTVWPRKGRVHGGDNPKDWAARTRRSEHSVFG